MDDGPVYPGTRRDGLPPGQRERMWHRRHRDRICDLPQGRVRQDIEHQIGDFVLFRADCIRLPPACAVDDCAQGITHAARR
jgi:glutamyl-Q tRNA(Asp) synthetase